MKNPNWGVKYQQKLIKRHNAKMNYSDCEYVTTLVRGEFHKLAPRECFEDFEMTAFEGKMFKIPAGFDKYLRCLYKGDYMQIPPEDQRKWHNTIIFWKSDEDKKSFYNSQL